MTTATIVISGESSEARPLRAGPLGNSRSTCSSAAGSSSALFGRSRLSRDLRRRKLQSRLGVELAEGALPPGKGVFVQLACRLYLT
jgi:hypothetical protein